VLHPLSYVLPVLTDILSYSAGLKLRCCTSGLAYVKAPSAEVMRGCVLRVDFDWEHKTDVGFTDFMETFASKKSQVRL
jgi:hypothetical protein